MYCVYTSSIFTRAEAFRDLLQQGLGYGIWFGVVERATLLLLLYHGTDNYIEILY
jgi:hypothetical protein